MDVSAALSAFGGAVTAKLRSNDGSRENHLRGPLEVLLKNIGQALGLHVVPIGETRLRDLGVRPDYAINVAGARVGYIELKAPDTGVPGNWTPTPREQRQWERLSLLPNVLYTDGQQWALYHGGELAGKIAHLSPSLDRASRRLRAVDGRFEQILVDFLRWRPPRPRTTRELVRAVAGLCRLLRDEVAEIIERESTGQSETAVFTVLAYEWRGLLFPHLTNRLFADAYAQTVTFAFLLARVEGIDFTNRSVGEIALLLGKKHSLMGKALAVLTQDSAESDSIVIDTLIRVIGVVEWDQFDDEAYPLLYENFLEAYDPDLRKASGSYYTPVEVVRFMTRFVDDVLRHKLERKTGFAANDVIVVDPAMGTGSFLEQIVHRLADIVDKDEGPGQVPARLRALSQRLIGFENQAAPYAVAELRLHGTLKAKYRAEIPDQECRFLSDTLDNPDLQELHFGTVYEAIARSRRGANLVKRSTSVMVVIGNPPYLEKARGRALWIEERGADIVQRPGLDAFRAPGLGKYEYVLSNLSVYFWRWATWKVFDAHPESPEGIVAFITTASYLNGPGFAGMREYLRRTSDEGWIIDLSPEGHRSDINTRIFPTTQHPVCIGIFVKRGQRRPDVASAIRYEAVSGSQEQKFERLASLSLNDGKWVECQSGWRDHFLPKQQEAWASYPLLGDLFPWCAPGVKTNRTWVYAPVAETLIRRWNRLVAAPTHEKSSLFKESRDANLSRIVKPLAGQPARPHSFTKEQGPCPEPVRIAYRSFDRQWLIPDSRLHHAPSPDLWRAHSKLQLYITEQHAHPITNGPALTFCSLVPDMDHYNNRGGRVLPLYRDSARKFANLAPGLNRALSGQLGIEISPEDILAYVACVVAHPEFTNRHVEQLAASPVRVPLTADSPVWEDAVEAGRRVLWLHTFGERFIDPKHGRPGGIPYLPSGDRPRAEVAIQGTHKHIPDEINYDATSLTLHIGTGQIRPVAERVWKYEVSGMRVIKRWFDYRKKKPRIRWSSPLNDIRPAAWDGNLTGELLDLLNVLGGCVALEPLQASILDRVLLGQNLACPTWNSREYCRFR